MTQRFVPFAYGFRSFFLLAGIYAALGMVLWLWLQARGLQPFSGVPAYLWHSHEMLYGFIGAALAGFVLTAVPSWTGSRGFAGAPLVVLVILWLAGRLAFAFFGDLPIAVTAPAELLFLPVLIAIIAPPLFRSRNRNRVLLLIIAAVWASDVVFVSALHDGNVVTATTALRVGIGVVLLLVTLIGGRIVPAFTANAVRKAGIEVSVRSRPVIEVGVHVAMLVYIIAEALAMSPAVIALVAALAAVLHCLRMVGWHSLKSRREPIVWILHLAYLWLPVGLAMRALFLGAGIAWAGHWQHALAAGAAGTMILAVMTRASLGHTGRQLSVNTPIVVAYVALLLGVAVRVFGPALFATSYSATVLTAGFLWALAFVLFTVVYAPILLQPRVDGKPG
jgi:uncharacterized protein involved in response to NO